MKRKICVVTGSRAEYGLLYWLMREIENDDDLELQLVVTGAHLSPAYGSTFRIIEDDGFSISACVEMLISSDTARGIAKSIGVGTIGFADVYERLKPDIVVVLGDRYELLSACSAALIANIPMAHIHGGELSEGAYDESIRHSLTKMAHVHFVSTEVYRKRVIQLGERPERVFCFGAPGIDNIHRLKLLDRETLESSIGFQLGAVNILCTYHPSTIGHHDSARELRTVLDAVSEVEGAKCILTYPGAEVGSSDVVQVLKDYVADHVDNAIAVRSLGQVRYLSAVKHADVVIGNSSSGIIEVPSFGIPTVNVGNRQDGRVMPSSVICCGTSLMDVRRALAQALSEEFRKRAAAQENPYGDGRASVRIKETLKRIRLDNNTVSKSFYDIPFDVE